jgi:hypothetical protein
LLHLRARGFAPLTFFGVLTAGNGKVYFVDDGSNTLNLLH